MTSYYEGVDGLARAAREASPDASFVDPIDPDTTRGDTWQGRNVTWWFDGNSVILVNANKLRTMEDNPWNFDQVAALMEMMLEGSMFEIPAARVYRITATDVKLTHRYARHDELSYQMGMVRPWEKTDIGDYHALLLDGNHRALAAMAIGEKVIPVYVGENYRDNVRKKDWLLWRLAQSSSTWAQ